VIVQNQIAPRSRKVRVLATLGPASNTPEMIRKLYLAGADAFRINMSHGAHAEKAVVIAAIRAMEKELGRPTTVLVDLQGPKLRVGTFAEGAVSITIPRQGMRAASACPTTRSLPHWNRTRASCSTTASWCCVSSTSRRTGS
jgi:pyruvate kinase